MKFPDEDIDDTDEKENVDKDGDNAGHLVDPVVQAVLQPTAAQNIKNKFCTYLFG